MDEEKHLLLEGDELYEDACNKSENSAKEVSQCLVDRYDDYDDHDSEEVLESTFKNIPLSSIWHYSTESGMEDLWQF